MAKKKKPTLEELSDYMTKVELHQDLTERELLEISEYVNEKLNDVDLDE